MTVYQGTCEEIESIALYLIKHAPTGWPSEHKEHHEKAAMLRRIKQFITELEIKMGIAADAINKLETALTAERVKSADLQSQLTILQGETLLDGADQTAIGGVDAFINPPPVTPPTGDNQQQA